MRRPTINKKLLPLKVHYFLKYGGMSFFPFLPALIRQKGVSEGGVGLIWTVIPLTSAATNMCVGTVSDYFKIHRAFFMTGMVILTTTFTCTFFMPDVPKPHTDPLLTTLSLQCPQDSVRFEVCQPEHLNPNNIAAPLFSECDYNETNSVSLVNKEKHKKYDYQCRIHQKQKSSENNSPFPTEFTLKLDNEKVAYSVCSTRNCTIITEANITSKFTEQYNVSCGDSERTSCEYECEATAINNTGQVTLGYLLKSVEFWLIFINMLILYAGNGITTTMADTVCFFLLGDKRYKYGHQRLWGSLAWGMIGMTSGALVTYFSEDANTVDYTPVIVISLLFLTANLVVSSMIKFDVPKKEKLQANVVGKTMCSFKMLVFLVTVLVGGITMGNQWTFFFIVVEDIALAWDPNFNYIKLIQGLLLGIDCFFGEVPFLFLSSYIIKKIGNVRTFSGVLVIFTLRYFLYSSVTNPWYFLPINFLHGPSFGLLYPNMITYANALAPKGAQATIQGTVKSTFICGVSLGGLMGGILIEKVGGSKTYLYIGLFDLVFTILFIVTNLMRTKIKHDTPRAESEQQESSQDDDAEEQIDEEAPLDPDHKQKISPLVISSSPSFEHFEQLTEKTKTTF